MTALLLLSAIIGLVIGGITGYALAGVLVGGFVFICGLPVALITDSVHDEVSYAQDRADERQELADLEADERQLDLDFYEDERIDRLTDAIGKVKSVINDNRQVHIHNQ
jgi:hypothetical protein